MAKELKDWIDEFVENGANPKDVTNWPEEAGGRGGSYSGPVLMPINAISREALGLDSTTEYILDCAKLADKLAELGIDVDAPWLREEESGVSIMIGGATLDGDNRDKRAAIFYILATNQGDNYAVSIIHDPTAPHNLSGRQFPIENQSIREVLEEFGLQYYNIPIVSRINSAYYRMISNEVVARRDAINDVEYKTIGDVQSFMKDILVPIGSGSGSSE